jgi:prevent-host-death family protein
LLVANKTYGAEEARAKLPELLERAHRGLPTVITKRGQPYAALVPPGDARTRQKGSTLMSLRGTGRGLWDVDVVDSVAQLREEWK